MEDSQIVELFFARSEQALSAMAEKYGRAVTRMAENILRSRRDAEEVQNDTLLAAWETIPPQRPESLAGYVMRLARNIAVARYHKNTAQKRNSFYDTALDELCQCVPGGDTAEDALAVHELTEEINAFLDTLGREDRMMFIRRYWFSDPVADIAHMLGTNMNRVSVRLFRMRERLRLRLEQRGIAV